MSLYSCRAIPDGGYAMTKLDDDLNPEATYEVTNATCTCPAGPRPTCKHRGRLLTAFLLRNHVDDGWFLNDQNMMWHRPVTEAGITPELHQALEKEGFEVLPMAEPVRTTEYFAKPTEATFKRRV